MDLIQTYLLSLFGIYYAHINYDTLFRGEKERMGATVGVRWGDRVRQIQRTRVQR